MKKVAKSITLVFLLLVFVVLGRTYVQGSPTATFEEVLTIAMEKEQIVRRMSEALQFQTISFGDESTQSYGEFDQFLEWLERSYPLVFANTTNELVAKHTLLLKWSGQDETVKPVLLTAHYDVVPVVPGSEGSWSHPPFGGAVDQDYVWGRGALDDKSAVIVMLEALTILIEQGVQPQRSIYFSFGHDEEVGGPMGAAGVTELLKSRGVEFEWSLDEGSFIGVGMMPGFDGPVASINVAEKGSLTLELIAEGPGGHSSMPAAEVSIDILAQALVELRKHPLPAGIDGLAAEMISGLAEKSSFLLRVMSANTWLFGGLIEKQMSSRANTNALIRTTTAPTILQAGIKTNVIPPSAKALVNFRVHPRDTAESIHQHVINAIDDPRVKVNMLGGGLNAAASKVSSWNSAGYTLISKVARQTYGDLLVIPGLTIGGTDSKHYSKISENSYRFQLMRIVPKDIEGFHGTNERVSIDNLIKGTTAYYLLLKGAAAGQ